jgi:SAM-dependent methyltransferase
MEDLSHWTPERIRAASYNQLIGLVRETNRTPGGNDSIHRIASRIFLGPHSSVLDIGTSTGATALELSRLTSCSVVGIDVNEESLAESRRRAQQLGLTRVRFEQADARSLPFPDASFDLVFCGNVTSLIAEPERAVAEYRRVTRFGGHLAAIPMYYLDAPPAELVARVSKAIQVDIKPRFRDEATAVFSAPDFELYDALHFRFDDVPRAAVQKFVRDILSQPHLGALSAASRSALGEVYLDRMLLFRDNLALMGYTILLLRRTRFREDPVLFTGHPI